MSHAPRRDESDRSRQLRVALVVDNRVQPAWVSLILRSLQQDPDLDVVVVVRPPVVSTRTPRRRYRRWSLSGLLHTAYQRLDRGRISGELDLTRAIDLNEIAAPDQLFETLADDDRFLSGVYLLSARPDDELLARFDAGLLSVRHDGADSGWTLAEREVMAGASVLHAEILLWRHDVAGSRVVQRSSLSIDRLSVAATARRYLLHLTHSLALRVTKIARGSLTSDMLAPPPPPVTPPPDATTLTTVAQPPKARHGGIVRSLTRMAALRLHREYQARSQQEYWTLGVARSDGRSPLAFDPAARGQQPRILPPPAGSIWADPFPLRRSGRTYVFYEEMKPDQSTGFISLLELTGDLQVHELGPVLNAPYHLSYPQVFEWQGTLFMLPETEQNRTVELHRCVAWPDRWTLEAVLLEDVSAVDATVVEIEGEWWMFTTMNPQRDIDWNTSLNVFRAPGLLGPWTPHPGNPVKADVRNSRSAGRLFWDAGRLFRPSQDCAERYGHAIVLNEILDLNSRVFRERATRRIAPDWQHDVVGMHTINQGDGVYLFDCRIRRRKGIG